VEFVCYAFQIYFVILLVRVIFSWMQAFGARVPDGLAPVYKIVYDLTEPLLAPFRRIIPPAGMFDISFLVAVILLQMVASIICSQA
jgi:YggT family protein